MKAALIHSFGSPGVVVLEEVPLPEPAPDEIRIRVIASGINPMEFQIRRGRLRTPLGRFLPVALGLECAGLVNAVGAKVTRFKKGDAVFASSPLERGGTHAEAVTLLASRAARLPKSISFEHAAIIPMAVQTAWAILEAADIRPGEQVLIHGAGGAVGHWLVQLAHRAGAYVVATALPADAARVHMLGAETRCSTGKTSAARTSAGSMWCSTWSAATLKRACGIFLMRPGA